MGRTLYGLKTCDACRKARRWLDEHGIEYEYHDVRADGIDRSVLQRWLKQTDWPAVLNKRSTTWRELADAYKEGIDARRAISLCVEHPTLIKRPVLEDDRGLSIGFSPEKYAQRLLRD